MKRNSADLKNRLKGLWLNAFLALAPQLGEAINKLGKNVPCPVDGGTDGFRLFDDAAVTGGGVKQSMGVIPEGIGMLMFVNNWDFKTTFNQLENWLGGDVKFSRIIPIKPNPKPRCNKSLRRWLNNMWLKSSKLGDEGTHPASAYFRRRWIYEAAHACSDIRYHPHLVKKDFNGKKLGTFGAVVGLVRNNQGKPVQLHRLFITQDGRKVDWFPGTKPRKLTPSVDKTVKGRHIRLFEPENGFLGVSEGVETALAVYQAKKFPVWPCLSATNLQSFIPPKGVHTVINFVDKDRSKTGEIAAEKLKDNLLSRGITVINLLPPMLISSTDEKGVDWADQLIKDPNGFNLLDEALNINKIA